MTVREHVEPLESRDAVISLARYWRDGPVRFMRNFDNLVYAIDDNAGTFYLRATPTARRSNRQIESELEILRYLASNGIDACQAILSRQGEYVHSTRIGGKEYVACLFTEAAGVSYAKSPPLDEAAFIRRVGRHMGRLHNALIAFPKPVGFERFDWQQDRWSRFEQLIPSTEVEAWELFDELRRWLGGQSKQPAGFSLIHGDFTIGNLHRSGDAICLFDFDACCDHWHAYEIAAFLHMFGVRGLEARQVAYDNLLDGYAEARPVGKELLDQIPMFGKMRLLYSFLVFAGEWGFEDLSQQQRDYFSHRRRLFRAPPTWPMG